MVTALKNIINKRSHPETRLQKLKIRGIWKSIQLISHFFSTTGFFRTAQDWVSLDANGEKIPWMTYPAVKYLQSLDMSQMMVFEWGSGHSTVFFAQRAQQVYSVENSQPWYQKVTKMVDDHGLTNSTVYFETHPEKYVNAVENPNCLFDILVVDAAHRRACLEKAKTFCKKNGFIILDNAEKYDDIESIFSKNEYYHILFEGYGPIHAQPWQTKVFIQKRGN